MSRTMMTLLLGAVFLALTAISTACSGSGQAPRGGFEDGELLVFAAASLSDALAQLQTEFEKDNGPLAFSFGASQALAQQITSGAPADVFIAAGKAPMDFVVERDAVDVAPVDLLGNSLVFVMRSDSSQRISSLLELPTSDIGRLAIADPDLAPAGTYARESLRALDLWEAMRARLVIAPDVRAALAYVETGNADAAIVYRTDARVARNVVVLDIVPPQSYPAVRYPAAVVRRSGKKERARAFLAFLQGDAATQVFRAHGFDPL